MKAVRTHPIPAGRSVAYEDIPPPKQEPGQALVGLTYAAVNRRDLMIASGEFLAEAPSSTMGSDGAGYLVEEERASSKSARQLVVINPVLSWGNEERQPDRSTIRTLGVPDNGTFAEIIAVPRENIHPAPPHLSEQEAAALPLAGVTAYRALFSRGQLTPGETVLITGIGGGVAHIAAQFALASGARVFVTSRTADNIEAATAMGASGGAATHDPDWARSLRSVMGPADLIIDTLGGQPFEHLTSLCREGGRIVTFGALAGHDVTLSMFTLFRKQIDIRGTSVGSPSDFAAMLELVESQHIRPAIAAEFPLSKVTEALRQVAAPRVPGKVVLQITPAVDH